jgi:hypothetical protein
MGGFWYGDINHKDKDILDFGVAYNMSVSNTFFWKRQSHAVISNSDQHSSQINFVLTTRMDRKACLD